MKLFLKALFLGMVVNLVSVVAFAAPCNSATDKLQKDLTAKEKKKEKEEKKDSKDVSNPAK